MRIEANDRPLSVWPLYDGLLALDREACLGHDSVPFGASGFEVAAQRLRFFLPGLQLLPGKLGEIQQPEQLEGSPFPEFGRDKKPVRSMGFDEVNHRPFRFSGQAMFDSFVEQPRNLRRATERFTR